MSYHGFRIADEAGLTVSQALAVMLLESSPMRMQALARSVRREAATITGVVDKLEGQGLARSERTDDDRRGRMVILTEAGERLAKRLIEA